MPKNETILDNHIIDKIKRDQEERQQNDDRPRQEIPVDRDRPPQRSPQPEQEEPSDDNGRGEIDSNEVDFTLQEKP